MRYLSKVEIIHINRRTIESHGGQFISPNNFLKEGSLDYLLEVVSGEMFGKPLYPTLADKAGLYCHSIVCNHIFSDGNKRTGLEAALLFLYINGYMLVLELTSLDIINFILRVAEGNVSLEECQLWFKEHTIKL